jgi:hypothetical protein
VEHLALGALDGGCVLGALGGHVAAPRAIASGQRHGLASFGSLTLPPWSVAVLRRQIKTPASSAGVRWVLVVLIA